MVEKFMNCIVQEFLREKLTSLYSSLNTALFKNGFMAVGKF